MVNYIILGRFLTCSSTCASPGAAVCVGQWLKALLRFARRLRMSRSSSAVSSASSTRTTLSRLTIRCLPCQHQQTCLFFVKVLLQYVKLHIKPSCLNTKILLKWSVCVCKYTPCAGVSHWGCSVLGHMVWLQSQLWTDQLSGTEATEKRHRKKSKCIFKSALQEFKVSYICKSGYDYDLVNVMNQWHGCSAKEGWRTEVCLDTEMLRLKTTIFNDLLHFAIAQQHLAEPNRLIHF